MNLPPISNIKLANIGHIFSKIWYYTRGSICTSLCANVFVLVSEHIILIFEALYI
jgi:hypothetical protein